MEYKNVEYTLVDGFIHNWLVASPQTLELPGGLGLATDRLASLNALAQHFYTENLEITQAPVDRGKFQVGEQELTWAYWGCAGDHCVNVSREYSRPQYVRAWAYTQLHLPEAQKVTAELFTTGPAQVWLNGQAVFRSAEFTNSRRGQRFELELRAVNELLVRFEAAGWGPVRQDFAVRLVDFSTPEMAQAVSVQTPTQAKFPYRQKIFEEMFEKAHLEHVAMHKGNLINLHWNEDAPLDTSYTYKVLDANRFTYVEGTWQIEAKPVDIGHPQRIWERPYWVTLQAPGREHWEQNMRYERQIPIYVLDNEFALHPKGSFVQRRQKALQEAVRRDPHLFAEIAKMTLEQWSKVNADNLLAAVAQVNQGDLSSPVLLVGLLGMLNRFEANPAFPSPVTKAVETAALQYEYDPQVASAGLPAVMAESRAILLYTAAILAGQRLARRSFKASGQTGLKLRQWAEQAALGWLRQRGIQGFTAWNASLETELVVTALAHLTSLAANETVRELSAVLLDKILFLLAVNSYEGIYSAAKAAAHPMAIKSAPLDALAGMSRMLWGVGVYNPHIYAVVSLAGSTYEFPSFFGEIATRTPAEFVHRERQVEADGSQANIVTYRTPDGMLSSVQDYRPGQPGRAEHVWQAALGPEALVFVNHPAVMSESDGCQPGFWLGNAVLPRLAQWQDALIAVHNASDDDWIGFTHAHFPVYAFDEHVFARGWAFARRGDGYIGITCRNGFEQIKAGPGAYRELRSAGAQNVWLCILGRKAFYKGFRKFQKRLMAIKPDWDGLNISFTHPRGEKLAFGWEGPLLVNDQPQALDNFKHIENPYCTAELDSPQMEIQFQDILMRLNFA